MRLLAFSRAVEFQDVAEGWLASAERENNLVITTMRAAAQQDGSSRGWLVTSNDAPQLALFQTPPQYLLLSGGAQEAAAWAAEALEGEVPGVAGPVHVTEAFAEKWSKRTGSDGRLNGEMTFFTLEHLVEFRRPHGSLRSAETDDFGCLMPMAIAAARDMNLPRPEQNPATVEKGLQRAIGEGRQFIWVDGVSICAMASYVNALRSGGARIRSVYTPPEFRGMGYGTAVTGAVAEYLLGAGQRWVCLFADNANPIASGIYRRLGFRPEWAYRSVRFE